MSRLRASLGGSRGRRELAAGLVLVVAAALALLVTLTPGSGLLGGGGERVRAEFSSTNELRPGDPVRVRGIEVGAVDEIEVADGGRTAVVTMRLENEEVRVHRDARADLRWRTMLGGSPYIDLDPGSPQAARLGAEVLPLARTTVQVEVDEALAPLRGSSGPAIRNILHQLSRGLGDGSAAGSAIESLAGLETVGRGVRPYLGERPGDLGRLIRGASRTVAAIDEGARRLGGLERLVSGGAATFGAVADAEPGLGDSLELAPGALAATRSLMLRLPSTLDRLDPLAAELEAAVGPLEPTIAAARPTLRRTRRLLDATRPLLRRLPPAFDAARSAGRQGAPLIGALDPTATRLRETLIPFFEQRDDETELRNYEAIGPTFAAAGSAAGEYDGGGYVLHFPTLVDERSVLSGPCQTHLSDPSAPRRVRCEALAALLDEIAGPDGGRG